MARRVRAGIAGGAIVSGLQTFTTTITSADDLDIIIDPAGTGRFLIDGPAQLQNRDPLRFATTNSANFVAFRGPTSAASNITWTLPNADGANTQVLTTDGSGNLSWTNKAVVIENNTTDSNTNYIFFSPSTSGEANIARISNPGLTFQPSTATLTCTNLSAGSITETSSITLKENISPIENALDIILKLDGVVYDRKDGSSKGEAGLIAEAVNQVLPNLVTKDENGNPTGINYTKFSAYLIEAVKTIKKEIDQLKRI
jgi:dipeptidyl aminopeptidase/acylaminoacyl peptidase